MKLTETGRRRFLGIAATLPLIDAVAPATNAAPTFADGSIGSVASIEALRRTSISAALAYLADGARSGMFAWTAGDHGALVAADPLGGFAVAGQGDPTGGSGAWLRSGVGAVRAEWFGAESGVRADVATVDSACAINAAVRVARALGREVRLDGGIYACGQPIAVPTGQKLVGSGCGYGEWPGANETATILLATRSMHALVTVEGDAILTDLAVNGAFLADIGVHVQPVARPYVANVRAWRCRHSGYLLERTQNGVFVNLFGQSNTYLFTLLNGARNNDFYGCSGTTWEDNWAGFARQHDLPPFADTAIFYALIDTGGGIAPSTQPDDITANGNDGNRVWGGIFEASACTVRVRNDAGIRANFVAGGRLAFHDAELTTRTILDTRTAAFEGRVDFTDCTFIGAAEARAALGTLGTVGFHGEATSFLGFDRTALRGWADIATNLLDHAYFSSSRIAHFPAGGLSANACTVTFDAPRRRFAVTQPAHPEAGLNIAIGGPLVGASATAMPLTASAMAPVMTVSFSIYDSAGGDMAVMALDDTKPFGRREIGHFGIGSHRFDVPMQAGGYGLAFCGGRSSGFRIGNIEMKLS